MKLGISLFALFVAASTSGTLREQQGTAGAEDASKTPVTRETKVRELMQLTGTVTRSDELLTQLLAQYETMRAMLPRGFVEKFRELAKKEDLVAQVMPIYKKHVDEATLDRALEFYRSEAGKRWSEAHTKIAKDMHDAGRSWGQKLGRQILRELRKKQ